VGVRQRAKHPAFADGVDFEDVETTVLVYG